MNTVKICDNIFYTGILDWDIRTFDIVMHTEYGTTYNSYLVKGSEKTALVEVAKETFFDDYLKSVEAICPISEIDYVVMDHSEPDHAGSLRKLLALNPEITVVASGPAIRFISEIVNFPFKSIAVKDGEELSLGDKTFRFISAPFLHWPDSMYTYCVEDKVLFTCDSFGCHYCSDKVFDDLIEGDFDDAYKYYFDMIMGPFKSYILSALDKIKDLDIALVCPGHGPVLRTDINKYLDLYRQWATPVKRHKKMITIGYVSAYGYTKLLAEQIRAGAKSAGDIEVHWYDLIDCDEPTMSHMMDVADGVLLGSPTIVSDTLAPIYKVLMGFNPVIHKGKMAGAFGSYGWSGEATTNIMERFKQLKFATPLPALKVTFRPSDDQLKEAFEFGRAFAEAVLGGQK